MCCLALATRPCGLLSCPAVTRRRPPLLWTCCTKIAWRRKKGYTYQEDRLKMQQRIQEVFETDNTVRVSTNSA